MVNGDNDYCALDHCFFPPWKDRYCRLHRAQIEYSGELSLSPLAKLMWLMAVADGADIERNERGCITWPFSASSGGYGVIARKFGDKLSMTPASRWLCEMVHGTPPDDGVERYAAHLCGRGRQGCVTPDHLQWKTQADNEADKIIHDTVQYGERSRSAKITSQQARAILLDDRPGWQVAADYGLAEHSVNKIKRGETWRRVYDEVVADGLTVARRPRGARGSTNSQAKLSTEQVQEIRASKERVKVLALRYGVSESGISAIRLRVTRRFE